MKMQTTTLILILFAIAFIMSPIIDIPLSHLNIGNTLITKQIKFLILVIFGSLIFVKFKYGQIDQSLVLRKVSFFIIISVVLDIFVYLLHGNYLLASIISLIILISGLHILRKKGYIKSGFCTINKN